MTLSSYIPIWNHSICPSSNHSRHSLLLQSQFQNNDFFGRLHYSRFFCIQNSLYAYSPYACSKFQQRERDKRKYATYTLVGWSFSTKKKTDENKSQQVKTTTTTKNTRKNVHTTRLNETIRENTTISTARGGKTTTYCIEVVHKMMKLKLAIDVIDRFVHHSALKNDNDKVKLVKQMKFRHKHKQAHTLSSTRLAI